MGSLGGGDTVSEMCGWCSEGEGGLSETVKVQFMVASHNFVRSQVCCARTRQRTATSVNLRLAFAMERCCLSRTSCVSVRAAGMSLLAQIAFLCFGGPRGWLLGWFLWLGGPHHREGKRRGVMVTRVRSGVGPWEGQRKDTSRGRTG